MYQKARFNKTSLKVNKSTIGETIEQKMERVLDNNEPVTDTAPIIYTERKDGVHPEMDIRTNKWEFMVDAADKETRENIQKRAQTIGEKTYDTMTDEQKTKFHKDFPDSHIKPPSGEKK